MRFLHHCQGFPQVMLVPSTSHGLNGCFQLLGRVERATRLRWGNAMGDDVLGDLQGRGELQVRELGLPLLTLFALESRSRRKDHPS